MNITNLNEEEFDNFQQKLARDDGILERYEQIKRNRIDQKNNGNLKFKMKKIQTEHGPVEVMVKPNVETGLSK